MSAGTYNLEMEAGATFTRTITYKDPNDTAIDLTGAVIRMQVRDSIGAETVGISLTSVGTAGISVPTPTNGTFIITVTPAQNSNLDFSQGVYDLEIEYSNGVVERVLEGRVSVKPQVTQ